VHELLHTLKAYYRHNRRKLPWRYTGDPYRILVSEMMLQQTPVERVVPFYKKFVRAYPSAKKLARAKLPQVLKLWQGLGYNRRAKYLHTASKQIARLGFPRWSEDIEKLPGVGRYTARAVSAFAFNEPVVLIETNVRTVFIHHFFKDGEKVADARIAPLVELALKKSGMEPKDFYQGVMDYGSHLKKSGVRVNKKSAHYSKQPKFEGSARQLRGAILRELLKHHATISMLAHRIPQSQHDLTHELARLTAEGLVALRGRYFSIPD
jgi:A/G-specific adenine glycosylase